MVFGRQWSVHDKEFKRHSSHRYIGHSFMLQNVEKTVVYGRSFPSFPFPLFQKKNFLSAFGFDTLTNSMWMLFRYKRVRRYLFKRQGMHFADSSEVKVEINKQSNLYDHIMTYI
jgi:hypothetical protein